MESVGTLYLTANQESKSLEDAWSVPDAIRLLHVALVPTAARSQISKFKLACTRWFLRVFGACLKTCRHKLRITPPRRLQQELHYAPSRCRRNPSFASKDIQTWVLNSVAKFVLCADVLLPSALVTFLMGKTPLFRISATSLAMLAPIPGQEHLQGNHVKGFESLHPVSTTHVDNLSILDASKWSPEQNRTEQNAVLVGSCYSCGKTCPKTLF